MMNGECVVNSFRHDFVDEGGFIYIWRYFDVKGSL